MHVNPKDLSPQKLHEHLLSAIAPRPIAFVSTLDENGVPNLSPFSFFNVFGSNPPILIFSPARSGRTGETKNTHDNVMKQAECVVNIAHADMIHQMNLAAGMYPKGVNEFLKSGLTPIDSILVKVPRVKESFVQFECKVLQVIETGTNGGAGNLIICEVVQIHIADEVLDESGSIDPLKMKYIARLGKQFWCHVGAENMFTIPSFKMANELGIGFDGLPKQIQNSTILSGNDLAQLASVSTLPTEEEINLFKKNFSNQTKTEIHMFAKEKIAEGNIMEAWKALLADGLA